MTTNTSAAADSSLGLRAQPGGPGIDPRGPRFSANITWVLLAAAIFVQLIGAPGRPAATLGGRVADLGFLFVLVLSALFAWGAFAGVQRHPFGLLFKRLVRPRLGKPEYLENPKPPTFAQLVGFLVTAVGLLLALLGVPYGLLVATVFAWFAAFLNGVFGYCLGCQIYLLLARAGAVRL